MTPSTVTTVGSESSTVYLFSLSLILHDYWQPLPPTYNTTIPLCPQILMHVLSSTSTSTLINLILMLPFLIHGVWQIDLDTERNEVRKQSQYTSIFGAYIYLSVYLTNFSQLHWSQRLPHGGNYQILIYYPINLTTIPSYALFPVLLPATCTPSPSPSPSPSSSCPHSQCSPMTSPSPYALHNFEPVECQSSPFLASPFAMFSCTIIQYHLW